jgi:biotin carboxylase
VLLDESQAHAWASAATYPNVFKLRCGAGATNVRLVHSAADAHRLIAKAFGAGFSQHNPMVDLRETWYRYRHRHGNAKAYDVLRSLGRFASSTPFARKMPPERSYVLFQQFYAGNEFDIRVVAIGGRACAVKRMVRPHDFRASGSGLWRHARHEIDERCVRIAFDVTQRLGMQCMGYDFVFDGDGNPQIIEMSYGFPGAIFRDCPGYWDKDLRWHEGRFLPQEWIVDTVVDQHRSRARVPR